MRITKFRITNYKSFVDSGKFSLSQGFNVIAGQNNVGKTALLEALSLQAQGKPHRSLLTRPTPTVVWNPVSSGEVRLAITGGELRELLLESNQFFVPVPRGTEVNFQQITDFLQSTFFSKDEIQFSIQFVANSNELLNWKLERAIALELYEVVDGQFFRLNSLPDKSGFRFEDSASASPGNDFSVHVASVLRSRIYRFSAERFLTGSCAFGKNEILAHNASNLAEVLNTLQANPAMFGYFNELVHRIFPSIYAVSVRPHPQDGNTLQILIWLDDPKNKRLDLAIELSESGTGVGQVLALLYVALNSKYAQTIIIDEPNSFLHPAAARKLIECLREFSSHQYIVSTHSSEILKATNPNTLLFIRWEKPQSLLEQVDADNLAAIGKILLEIGVKLSDVFGADRILWVEGDTEEKCFPILVAGHVEALGTNIVGVRNTGDFHNKRLPPDAIFTIYEKLSKGKAIVPPAIAFLFDQEERTEDKMQELRERSNGKICFLPRRMYENYLLVPSALVAIMNDQPSFRDSPVREGEVVEWLLNHGRDRKYNSKPIENLDIMNADWLKSVHAGRLLEDLFQELSESKYRYLKTEHSVQLTEWLIGEKPEALGELRDFLLGILRRSDHE